MHLSSKFRFDVSLSLNIEEGGDGDDVKAAVDADSLDYAMGTVKRVINVGGDILSLPIDGRFDYSELVPDSYDEVSDDDGPAKLVSVFCGIWTVSLGQQSFLLFLVWQNDLTHLLSPMYATTNYSKQKVHQKEHNRCQYFF
jgi:hypothetical protein